MRYPKAFDVELTRCPLWHINRAPDPWRDAIVELARDYEAGLIVGWPESYNAAAVSAVRYLLAESNACRNDLEG